MIDNALHDGFDRWLEEFVASGKNDMYVLRGECAEARLRCVDGAIYIAVFAVGSEHQQQGVFTAFLEHCEATGRAIVVELVEGEDFRRFMARRPGYVMEDATGGFAPTWRRSACA